MLKVTVSADKTRRANAILVEVANDSPDHLQLVYWRTPFDAAFHDFLQVTQSDGLVAEYIGPRAKYVYDPEFSIVHFKPGETKAVSLDLSGRYDLTLTGLHEIAVRDEPWLVSRSDSFAAPDALETFELVEVARSATFVVFDGSPAAELAGLVVDHVPAEVISEGETDSLELDQAAPVCPPTGFCVAPAYKDQGGICDTGNRYIAYPRTHALSANQKTLLRGLHVELSKRLRRFSVGNSATFIKWFGPYTTASLQKVQSTCRSIVMGACLSFEMYYINQTSDVIAAFYTYPANQNRTNSMALYNRFFQLSNYGVNSKIGTLAHELTHGFAGTKDHAYGTTRCAQLARTNPQLAMANADSYEFFLEELILRS